MKNKKQNECDKPCGTCPFLTKNLGRSNPSGFEQMKAERSDAEFDPTNWYSEKNLTRLWRDGLRKGEAMLCHSSDPNAANYGGTNAKQGGEKLCTGAVLLVFLHIKQLERLIAQNLKPSEVQKQYRAFSKYPMTKDGQVSWVMNFAIGRTDLFGGLPIKRNIAASLVNEISVPWFDSIINKNDSN